MKNIRTTPIQLLTQLISLKRANHWRPMIRNCCLLFLLTFDKSNNFFYKNVTPCHGFPLERFKNFPVWDCLACHSISLITLSCHGLGMAFHGMSKDVTWHLNNIIFKISRVAKKKQSIISYFVFFLSINFASIVFFEELLIFFRIMFLFS
jgi:hypothetical protein